MYYNIMYLLNAIQLILHSIRFGCLQLNHFYEDEIIVIVFLGDLRK